MEWRAIAIGGGLGALSGFVGAYVAALLQWLARRLRNDVLLARGETAWKDVIFAPLWRVMTGLGLVAGAVTAGFGGRSWCSILAGAIAPMLIASTSVWILAQARR